MPSLSILKIFRAKELGLLESHDAKLSGESKKRAGIPSKVDGKVMDVVTGLVLARLVSLCTAWIPGKRNAVLGLRSPSHFCVAEPLSLRLVFDSCTALLFRHFLRLRFRPIVVLG